jgi:hypothetical protein
VLIVRVGSVGNSILVTLGGSLLFVSAMILVIRPVARRWLDRRSGAGAVSQDLVAALLIFAFASAWTTGADPKTRRLHGRIPAAVVFCIYRVADADRIARST